MRQARRDPVTLDRREWSTEQKRFTHREEDDMPTTKKSSGFTDAEKSAMKARAEELRTSGRGGAKKAEEAQACLDAIAAMPDDDRALAERVHTLVSEAVRRAAPEDLVRHAGVRPRRRQGRPASSSPLEVRRVVRDARINDVAKLDDGDLWPTEYAVTSVSTFVTSTLEKCSRRWSELTVL